MAVVKGTNAGIVTTAPTSDPSGAARLLSGKDLVTQITPSADIHIIEIGWWCDTATSEANFEVGYYDDFGFNLPKDLQAAVRTNSKGTTTGWKKVTVDWNLSSGVRYWIAVQLDSVVTTNTDSGDTGEYQAASTSTTETTLPSNWSGSATANKSYAIYALVEAGATDYTEELSESFSISDSLSKTSIFNIALSETFNLADSLTSAADYNRLLDDIQTIQDSLSSSQGFKVLLTELQSITDSLSREAQYNINLDDTITMTDTLVDTLAVLARVYREIILKLKTENITLNQIGTPQTLKLKDKSIKLQ